MQNPGKIGPVSVDDIVRLVGNVLGRPPGQNESRGCAFLKLTGIPSESKYEGHNDEIEVLDFHWSVVQPKLASASTTGAQTTERAHFGDLSIYKALDMSTPALAHACASGTHLSSARLQLCRAGGETQPFMEYNLTDVIITSIRSGGRGYGENIPIEELSLSYATIEWKYIQTKVEGGKAAGSVVKSWNLKTNKG